MEEDSSNLKDGDVIPASSVESQQLEPQKIKDAREWLRAEMRKYPQYRYIDSRTYDEFYEWCGNYAEENSLKFYEYECEDIWESERQAELDRRKRDGRWYVEQEDILDGIHAYTWDEIDYLEFPEQPWRIRNLLPLEGFVILAGVSGDGKSFVSMEMANALTTPRPFLNEESFSVIGTNVLYVDAEMSKSELQRRGRQLGFAEKRKHELFFVSRDALNLKDEDGEDLEKVIRIIEEHKIGVVFMDTLRAVAGGMEENKAEEVRKFFNRFKPLKDMGVCIVFLDHLRKEFGPKRGEPQKDNLLASQDKTASVEVLLMLQRKVDEPIITVHQRKNRLGPETPSFDIRMYDTNMDTSLNRTILEFAGTHEGVQSVIERAKVMALEALQDGDMTRQELITHLSKSADVGKRSAHVAIKALQEGKLVNVEKVGKQHKLSANRGDTGDVENKDFDF